MSYQPKSNRKFFATALTTAVVASAVAPVAVSADHVFSDVEDGQYYSEAVQHLADQGILQGPGDGTFNPNGVIDRASAAEVLMKAKDLTPGGTEDFSDVEETDWFYNAIRATSPVIFEGDENGDFNPADRLTREQAAAIIVRAYQLAGESNHDFPDVEEGSWAEGAIAIAAENGIIEGNENGEFMPKDYVTRRDFAVMVYRAMQGEDSEGSDITVDSTTVVDATTLEVTLSNGDTVTVELEEALVNGENEVTFEVEGEEYTVTVDYDAVTPAVEAAEEAIAELPEEVTLEDAEAVEEARVLVDAALELDEDAEIAGLDTLVTAEETIAQLEAEAAAVAEATEAVEAAEDSLLQEDVQAAQKLVNELKESDDKVLLNARLVNVQEQLDSIVDTVNAAEGELETFRALDVKPLENVKEDYINAYVTAIEEATTGEEGKDFETVTEIQGLIDQVNEAQLAAELQNDLEAAEAAVASVESVEADVETEGFTDHFDAEEFTQKVEAAQEAIHQLPEDYKENKDADKTVAESLQERLDSSVEVVENYVHVVNPILTANTQVKLYNLLAADFENVKEDNISDYKDALIGSVTVEDVQYAVDFVNAENAIQAFSVKAETTQEDIDALEALVPLTGEEDEEGNPTATDEEQNLLHLVNGLQTEFDNLKEATEELAEAVTAAEAAQEAYLTAGGSEDDDLYKAVEEALTAADEVDVDSTSALVAATDSLVEATNALEASTKAKEDLAAAVTEAEAAQEAYVAAGGEEEDALYVAVTEALDADTPVKADIETAAKELKDATAELVLVNDVNDAETAEELETALVNLENGTYNNLSSVQRLEVAEWFLATVADQDPAFEESEVISVELDAEITDYQEKIAKVNAAASITEMDQALEALEMEEYEALSAAEQLAVAENVLNDKPEDEYTSIASIVANF
ncbi:S-layer homology domain-containing protein [Halobacillus karajensis]|uniref:Parasporal protein n=1 Tax=Halobacillus karajensis TaxID=195088 RepID=A0A059NWV4_9BACI|nr:S-layer homology domain-containing protein [Halobacillus karajensis]CDQ18928.1 Parasporal protein [Halobacillus karajensis]CDQ22999.1 Parasporal protein [Halobacillus karajensis]CDQ26481.1 Parasporal protein [Halobacillus karajensis]